MQNYIGDSFLNACLYKEKAKTILSPFFNAFFSWTEPHILIFFCLVLLLILPLIFLLNSKESYVKISRLYNVFRLSILTFFHRLVYIYLIFIPISFFIHQTSPCHDSLDSDPYYNQKYYLPNPKFASFCFFFLFLYSIASAMHSRYMWIIPPLILFAIIHYILMGEMSFAQTFCTFSLAYIMHFYSMRVKFWVMHIENIVLPAFYVIFFIVERNKIISEKLALSRTVITLALWIGDAWLLGRYHITRRGFVSIGRPIDLQWETDQKTSSYFTVISSEAEEVFSSNLKSDIMDSSIALFVYCFCLIFRHYIDDSVFATDVSLI